MATEKSTNYTRRQKCQIQGKWNVLALVDMFSKIEKNCKNRK